jgi:hypothetical protein
MNKTIHLRMVAPDQFQYFFDLETIEKKDITNFSLSKRMPISGDNNNNHNNNNNKCASEITVFKHLLAPFM